MTPDDFLALLRANGINLSLSEIRGIISPQSERDITDVEFVEEPESMLPATNGLSEQRKIALPILLRLMELRPDLTPAQIATTSHMIAKLFLQEP